MDSRWRGLFSIHISSHVNSNFCSFVQPTGTSIKFVNMTEQLRMNMELSWRR